VRVKLAGAEYSMAKKDRKNMVSIAFRLRGRLIVEIELSRLELEEIRGMPFTEALRRILEKDP
jgi:hypothetical protein